MCSVQFLAVRCSVQHFENIQICADPVRVDDKGCTSAKSYVDSRGQSYEEVKAVKGGYSYTTDQPPVHCSFTNQMYAIISISCLSSRGIAWHIILKYIMMCSALCSTAQVQSCSRNVAHCILYRLSPG